MPKARTEGITTVLVPVQPIGTCEKLGIKGNDLRETLLLIIWDSSSFEPGGSQLSPQPRQILIAGRNSTTSSFLTSQPDLGTTLVLYKGNPTSRNHDILGLRGAWNHCQARARTQEGTAETS